MGALSTPFQGVVRNDPHMEILHLRAQNPLGDQRSFNAVLPSPSTSLLDSEHPACSQPEDGAVSRSRPGLPTSPVFVCQASLLS